jgi:phage protein D
VRILLHPQYDISFSGAREVQPSSNDLLSLRVDLHLDTPADSCRLTLRPGKWIGDIKKRDPITVSLGYEEDLLAVFTGWLDTVEHGIRQTRTNFLGGSIKLLNFRVNEIYTDQTAGGIVKDLAAKAGLGVGEIQDGLDLPSYYVDNTHNAYDHIRELAERCAFDVYTTPYGGLTFKKYEPAETHPLEYGKNIISIDAVFRESAYQSVKAYGESPSSRKGDDTTNWLTKDDISGEVGSGNQLEIVDPAVRDTDTAEKVAQARLKVLSLSKFFKIVVVGSHKIKLGDAVEVKNMPDIYLNGKLKVMRVEHILNKSEGFTTHIECAGEVVE